MPDYCMQQTQKNTYRTIIKTLDNNPVFLLVGKVGVRGSGFTLYAMDGTVRAQARQTSFALASHFDLYDAFNKVGSIQRLFPVNKDVYFVHKLGWVVHGDFLEQSYKINYFRSSIMEMERAITINGETSLLSIPNEENAPLCICITAVMNYWLYNKKKIRKKAPIHLSELNAILE